MAKNHQASQSIDLFEFEESSSHIHTLLKLGGAKHIFIIDTGASISVIDRTLAEPYLLAHEEEVIAYGIGGELEDAAKIWVDDAMFSRSKLPPFPMLTANLDQLRHLYRDCNGPEVAGLIGNDFLRLFDSTISYRSGRITISIPDEGFNWDSIPALLRDLPKDRGEVKGENPTEEKGVQGKPKAARKKNSKATQRKQNLRKGQKVDSSKPKATVESTTAKKTTTEKGKQKASSTENALEQLRNATKASPPSPAKTKGKNSKKSTNSPTKKNTKATGNAKRKAMAKTKTSAEQ